MENNYLFDKFVALDVETATSERSSICEIGIAVINNGVISECKSWLIQPPGNKYDSYNSYVHGIGPSDTKDKPFFPQVWNEVLPYVENKIVVCHYSAFDIGAIRDALSFYNIAYPTFDIMCTIRLSKKIIPGLPSYTLDSVYYGLFDKGMENHHHACNDAIACAEILIECLRRNNIKSREDIEKEFAIKIGHIGPDNYCNQHAISITHGSGYISAKNIICENGKKDPDNYFYGKTVCFTGAFSFCVRKDLFQYIADIGGTPADRVTKETDILVVGQQDYRIVGDSGMSSKQRRALELLGKGLDIEILSESDFLSYASDFEKK